MHQTIVRSDSLCFLLYQTNQNSPADLDKHFFVAYLWQNRFYVARLPGKVLPWARVSIALPPLSSLKPGLSSGMMRAQRRWNQADWRFLNFLRSRTMKDSQPSRLPLNHLTHTLRTWGGTTVLLTILSLMGCQSAPPAANAPSEQPKAPTAVTFEINEQGLTAPTEVSPGLINVTLKNSGQAPHVLFVSWLAEGVTAQAILDAPPPGDPTKSNFVGGLFMTPGL